MGLAVFTMVCMSASASWSMAGVVWSACWAVMGIGLALLLTQSRAALWPTGLAVVLWHVATGWWSAWAILLNTAGTVWACWAMWKRLRLRFVSTSHPFARQITTVAFLRLAVFLGAPLAATGMTLAHWATWHGEVNHIVYGLQLWGGLWLHAWLSALCGLLLFTPLMWEWQVARVRMGRRRWWPKLAGTLWADRWVWLAVAGAIGLARLCQFFQHLHLAWGMVALVWAGVGWHVMRTTALSGYSLISGTGMLLLLPMPHEVNEGMRPGLAVLCGAVLAHLLLVTAQERRLALQRLERHADTDPLTSLLSLNGLYRLMDDWIEQINEEATISSSMPVLVSVHMSNADAMEQLLGTRQSDVIERTTAGALANAAPKLQWARIAKAHFVGWAAVLPPEQLRPLMGRLRVAAVESKVLQEQNQQQAGVGTPLWAVAAVELDPDPSPPPIEVVMACLHHTEQAAQDSRELVIHRVNQAAAQALKLEAEQAEQIRQIIQNKDILLYAQPIVANRHPETMPHKYEILIRMQDAQGGIVPPGRFLAVAMRAGLMHWLDMAVMDKTFVWFATHPDALARLNHCAINLSGPTVAHPDVARRIQQGLTQYQLPAAKFTFEITESQAIANPAQATDTIRAIRACGCRVAIDDFGTGVATFDYLKRFDVDYIKIDGAFIKSLLDDPVDRVIVESIVKVAHQLQVRTVAEFVSTTALHTAVTALGVDESQGFVFGEPRPLHHWFGLPPDAA